MARDAWSGCRSEDQLVLRRTGHTVTGGRGWTCAEMVTGYIRSVERMDNPRAQDQDLAGAARGPLLVLSAFLRALPGDARPRRSVQLG